MLSSIKTAIFGKAPPAPKIKKPLAVENDVALSPWLDKIGRMKFEGRYQKLVREARAIGQSNQPMLLGPWLSEVGFEVLYWIPMLRFLAKQGSWRPENFWTLTRGGAAVWYNGLANHGIEIFELVSPSEFKAMNERRWQLANGGQKQKHVSEIDQAILNLAREKIGHETTLFHPKEMYQNAKYFWNGTLGLKWLEEITDYSPFESLAKPPGLSLPDDYFCVKFYFNASFPETAENKAFCADLIRQLAKKKPVVLLTTALDVDDHRELDAECQHDTIRVDVSGDPANNLAVQTAILSNSAGFYGTYGGFSYLPMFYNVPSTAFVSDVSLTMPLHHAAALHASTRLRFEHGYARSIFRLEEVSAHNPLWSLR